MTTPPANSSPDGDAARSATKTRRAKAALVCDRFIVVSFAIYAVFAPHSIAGAWIGLSFVVLGWLARTATTGSSGLRRTPFDLPLALFFAWTVLSAVFSAEPRISLAKLVSASTFLIFYLAQATLTRHRATLLAGLMIASGVAGVLWSLGEVALGRGFVVDEIAADSPLRETTQLQTGDALWRVNERRVSSVEEADEIIRRTPTGTQLVLSVITRGEHVEWKGPIVTDAMRARPSPSGLAGTRRTHRFRASGWTRHYQTHAEVLQMLAQLALGFALANLQRRRPPRHIALPAAAFLLLAVGISLTAMRTVLVAFMVGAVVVGWRAATRGRARAAVAVVVLLAVGLGALAVSRTRASGALLLQDESARLRGRVARVVVERIPQHPVFGHGMDAMHKRWREWGFPGDDMLHAHSTPLQIAFDRGLPALVIWLWLMAAFWLALARAQRAWRDADDSAAHGLLLGASGALAGFLASSLVNYNFGDSEVALLLWWLMGACMVVTRAGFDGIMRDTNG